MELPLVRSAAPQDIPSVITRPSQFTVEPAFDPFNWTPVSLAISDLYNHPDYSLSGVSPEDMNLRL